MNNFRIRGSNRLTGELCVGGGKNAVLPILAAVVLNQGNSIIHNCPRIQDTFLSIKILESIGCQTVMEGNTLEVDASGVHEWNVPTELATEMRSSIIFVGGMLGRLGEVNISLPGGCELGPRPIDLHIKALRELGAQIEIDHGILRCKAKGLTGTQIHLDQVSVGATENIMLAASAAEGETIIYNAACEPEIADLQQFINKMGGDIQGAGTSTVVIHGVKRWQKAEHTVMPDRIVAGTYMVAAAVTGGDLRLTHVTPAHLVSETKKLMTMGCDITVEKSAIRVKAPNRLKSLPKLQTEPYPGFPTDMQAQFVAALAIAEGSSVVEETIFNERNKHVEELNRMGANITEARKGMSFFIQGVERLQGTKVEAKELRGGAALILAGLAAEGETVVTNAHFVQRGYENIETAFSGVGADIVLE